MSGSITSISFTDLVPVDLYIVPLFFSVSVAAHCEYISIVQGKRCERKKRNLFIPDHTPHAPLFSDYQNLDNRLSLKWASMHL